MQPQPAAFDAFAADYDAAFSDTRLGQMLRRRVWAELARVFSPGDHVLELACGTGEDALWLAGRGVRVTATDGAPAMVAQTRRKAVAAGLDVLVETAELSLESLGETAAAPPFAGPFDGAFSNFGGLNTLPDWRPLARGLAAMLRPGTIFVAVPMGPWCPWEIAWHAAHGEWRTAGRRFRGPAPARIGAATLPIYYPSVRRLAWDLRPWFRRRSTGSLGLWLPPSYLGHLVRRHPALFAWLDRLEARTARLTGGWGDHYIAVFERTATAL